MHCNQQLRQKAESQVAIAAINAQMQLALKAQPIC